MKTEKLDRDVPTQSQADGCGHHGDRGEPPLLTPHMASEVLDCFPRAARNPNDVTANCLRAVADGRAVVEDARTIARLVEERNEAVRALRAQRDELCHAALIASDRLITISDLLFNEPPCSPENLAERVAEARAILVTALARLERP